MLYGGLLISCRFSICVICGHMDYLFLPHGSSTEGLLGMLRSQEHEHFVDLDMSPVRGVSTYHKAGVFGNLEVIIRSFNGDDEAYCCTLSCCNRCFKRELAKISLVVYEAYYVWSKQHYQACRFGIWMFPGESWNMLPELIVVAGNGIREYLPEDRHFCRFAICSTEGRQLLRRFMRDIRRAEREHRRHLFEQGDRHGGYPA